jgi:hypothetical protein
MPKQKTKIKKRTKRKYNNQRLLLYRPRLFNNPIKPQTFIHLHYLSGIGNPQTNITPPPVPFINNNDDGDDDGSSSSGGPPYNNSPSSPIFGGGYYNDTDEGDGSESDDDFDESQIYNTPNPVFTGRNY